MKFDSYEIEIENKNILEHRCSPFSPQFRAITLEI